MPKCDFNNFIEITLRHGCSPVNLLHVFRIPFLKGVLSSLRQVLAAETPLKMMKMLFISRQKLVLFSRYLSFYLGFLVKLQNGFMRKIRLISNFTTSQPD